MFSSDSIVFEVIFYLALTFLLLGFRVGFALIISVISFIFLNVMYCSALSLDESKNFSEHVLKYLEYYVYVMWGIGVVWRILTFRRNWSNFMESWKRYKTINTIIKNYK